MTVIDLQPASYTENTAAPGDSPGCAWVSRGALQATLQSFIHHIVKYKDKTCG